MQTQRDACEEIGMTVNRNHYSVSSWAHYSGRNRLQLASHLRNQRDPGREKKEIISEEMKEIW